MAIVTTDNRYYSEIADAIRAVNGLSDSYTPAQMAAAILALGDFGYLPRGYTLLEYIQSSGAQWIDTGVTPDSELVVQAKFYVDAETGGVIIGNVISDSSDYRLFNYKGEAYFDMGSKSIHGGSLPAGAINEVEFGNYYVKNLATDTILVSGAEQTWSTTAYTIHVFHMDYGSGSSISGKIYYLKIFDGTTLIRQYVPCINPDGEVGLYDLVGKKFYGNAGTGVFTAGQSLVEAEYIESSGTQYVDSGVVGKSGLEVNATWMFTTSNSYAVIGSVSNGVRIYPFHVSSTPSWGYGYGSWVEAGVSPSVNVVYNIYSKLYAGEQILAINGTTVASGTNASTYNNGANMYIFALHNSGSANNHSSARLYGMQIYDNGTMVRDYAPYLRSDGVYGLYDKANNKFYTNAGSGSFVGG